MLRSRDHFSNFCTMLVQTDLNDGTAQNVDFAIYYLLFVLCGVGTRGYRGDKQSMKK